MIGVLEDISQPTLPNTVFYGVEAVETCIPQELHKAEYEVRDIKEEQRQERDFEDEKQVPEVGADSNKINKKITNSTLNFCTRTC